MRTDEKGSPCPETLGEYIDLVDALCPGTKASAWLQTKIDESPNGRDEKVLAPDSQMRIIIYNLIHESLNEKELE